MVVPLPTVSDQFYQLLAKIAPFEQTQECLGRGGQPGGDRLARTQLAAGHQARLFRQGRRPILHMFADDEALHLEPAHQNQLRVRQRYRRTVITRNHAAHRDTAKGVHVRQDGIEHHATDTLEISVDALGAGGLQCT